MTEEAELGAAVEISNPPIPKPARLDSGCYWFDVFINPQFACYQLFFGSTLPYI